MASLAERFWKSVAQRGPDECWPWIGSADRDGYGRTSLGNKRLRAHRVAWELANRRQADGCVCHSCDNPACVNPAHLWVGSQADNLHDMRAKGRHPVNGPQGRCNKGHILTPENRAPNGGGKTICRTCRGTARQVPA